jgi:hypothetical protein
MIQSITDSTTLPVARYKAREGSKLQIKSLMINTMILSILYSFSPNASTVKSCVCSENVSAKAISDNSSTTAIKNHKPTESVIFLVTAYRSVGGNKLQMMIFNANATILTFSNIIFPLF